jgi:hypothetical protein
VDILAFEQHKGEQNMYVVQLYMRRCCKGSQCWREHEIEPCWNEVCIRWRLDRVITANLHFA